MDTDYEPEQPTRMLFLGEHSLADGFRLIGFETHRDPNAADVDRIFRDLLRNRERAFVVVDETVLRLDSPNLKQARGEGGRIVVIAVPALNAPTRLSSDVAERLGALFGAATLHTGDRP